jgi:CheY-like chemotaxis protein
MLAYAGKTLFVQSHVNMSALVDDMLSMLKSTLPQNVTIKHYLTRDIISIIADASQIRQIVMNLIINASESIGEEQGEIVVSLTRTAVLGGLADKDHLGKIIPPGQYLCLEVIDTGCGMDDETKQRIFEPFYTTKFFGRGLGLSVVLGTITSHKGALQLSSQPGHGSTFKVYLPVQISEPAGKELPQCVAPEPWQGCGMILLAEDEPQLLAVAKNLLETLGFLVIEASNGIEAIDLYRKNAADITLVVTDIGMPLMGGYELITELKKLDQELPIIISSGFGDLVVTSKIPPGDIVGLINKPYSFEQLREVLKCVVEKTVPKAL